MTETIIAFTSNKKINFWISKIIFAIHKDVSYSYGGWLFFGGRMIYNAFLLYFFMQFIRVFFMFVFEANGIVSQEHLDVIPVILWAIGLIWLVNMVGRWREEDGR